MSKKKKTWNNESLQISDYPYQMKRVRIYICTLQQETEEETTREQKQSKRKKQKRNEEKQKKREPYKFLIAIIKYSVLVSA